MPYPGALAVYSRSSPTGRLKALCTKCGARLLHQHVLNVGEAGPYMSVKAGCLDGLTKDLMRSAVHIWMKSAAIDIPKNVEAYQEEPPGGGFRGD